MPSSQAIDAFEASSHSELLKTIQKINGSAVLTDWLHGGSAAVFAQKLRNDSPVRKLEKFLGTQYGALSLLQREAERARVFDSSNAASVLKQLEARSIPKGVRHTIEMLNFSAFLRANAARPDAPKNPYWRVVQNTFTAAWPVGSVKIDPIDNAALQAVADRLENDDLDGLVTRAGQRIASDSAGRAIPESVASVAEHFSSDAIQAVAALLYEAARDGAQAGAAARPVAQPGDADQFWKIWWPVVLVIAGLILAPYVNRLIDYLDPPPSHVTENTGREHRATRPTRAIHPEIGILSSGLYVVASQQVVLRLGPSTQQRYTAHVEPGEVVRFLKRKGPWVLVKYKGHQGWLKSKYLQTFETESARLLSIELIKEFISDDGMETPMDPEIGKHVPGRNILPPDSD